LTGGDTPWPAGRTRVTMQSGYIAGRVWGSRCWTGSPACARGPLPTSASSAAAGLYPSPRTPLLITAHRSLETIRRDQDSAARNAPRCAHWSPECLSPLGLETMRQLAPPNHSEPPRPSDVRRADASDMRFTRMRCAPGAIRSCGPDAPHASQRLLSIERATSTPRASTTPASPLASGHDQAPCPRAGRPIQTLRGATRPVGHAAPAPTTARRRGFTPKEAWFGHPLSPVDAGLRWKLRAWRRCGNRLVRIHLPSARQVMPCAEGRPPCPIAKRVHGKRARGAFGHRASFKDGRLCYRRGEPR
jgi:hypothetical protein